MMKNLTRYVILSFCLASVIACTQNPVSGASAPQKIETEDQKTLYALGLLLGLPEQIDRAVAEETIPEDWAADVRSGPEVFELACERGVLALGGE